MRPGSPTHSFALTSYLPPSKSTLGPEEDAARADARGGPPHISAHMLAIGDRAYCRLWAADSDNALGISVTIPDIWMYIRSR